MIEKRRLQMRAKRPNFSYAGERALGTGGFGFAMSPVEADPSKSEAMPVNLRCRKRSCYTSAPNSFRVRE